MIDKSHASESSVDATCVVVNLVGESAHGLLAESRFVERPFLPGGEHNMYEFAFAAAANGFDVELRGWLERAAYDQLATGAGVAPRVGLPARLPEQSDLVVVPEGWQDPLEYARLILSPARLAIFVLAPLGLFGWPFTAPGWSRPDPLTVPLDAVAKTAHFQAMDALGISLLTHSPGLVAASEAAGVPCAFVGTGRPVPMTPPSDDRRSVDAAALTANRWAPLVDQVAQDLDGLDVDLIGETTNEQVLARLARSRTLLWPSRIEGHATIPWEARSLGCVPVALSTNRFAVGLSAESGAVVVDRVDQIAPAVRELLADEGRWSTLSRRARSAARTEVRWDAYVDRVGDFLRSIVTSNRSAGPERWAYAGMGAALAGWIESQFAQAQESMEEIDAERERVVADRDELATELNRVRVDRDELATELQRVRVHRDRLAQNLAALHDKRAVQIALRLAELTSRGARRDSS